MHSLDTAPYTAWFLEYCRTFDSDDSVDAPNFRLKEVHTYRVRDNAVLISRGLGLDGRDAALAELAALLHDVGRFPQYRQYRTFRDSDSVNHAAVGAKVLMEQNVLGGLPQEERDLIVRAVTLHNVFAVPPGLDDRTLLFLRIVRDADKLDIWRVFIEYFVEHPEARPSAATLGLPETEDYSPAVLAQLKDREMVTLTSLRTQNDFKLLQLAWIYDLNFAPSLRLLRDRGILDRLAGTLPRVPEVAAAVNEVRRYLDERLSQQA